MLAILINYQLQNSISDQAFKEKEPDTIFTVIQKYNPFFSLAKDMQDLKGLKRRMFPSGNNVTISLHRISTNNASSSSDCLQMYIAAESTQVLRISMSKDWAGGGWFGGTRFFQVAQQNMMCYTLVSWSYYWNRVEYYSL